MDLKEMSISIEAPATTTASSKATTVIASTISEEYLKVLELKEACKIAEYSLMKYESEIQALISSMNENSKAIADYKKRDKINVTNSESLLQAKNELYKFKCELKSSYIATEKSRKSKQLMYKKIVSSYDLDWQNALKKFNANPVVVELQRLEEENTLLETKTEKQERLTFCTEKQFLELKEHLRLMFLNKTVEFSKAMIQCKKSLNLKERNKERASVKLQKASREIFEFKLFGERPPLAGKNSPGSGVNEDSSCFSSIDVSIFDDITVPEENLESQHLEEDLYSTSQSKEHISDISKDQEEDLECSNKLKGHQPMEDQRVKKPLNGMEWNSMEIDKKATMVLQQESQYFRLQESHPSRQSKTAESSTEKLKSEASQILQENEEENLKERQIEYEESFSEGNSDNQLGSEREIYDSQYRKTSSFSSDEFPLSTENVNEGPNEEEGVNLFKPCDTEKNDCKSFTGFFTMGDDHNSSKPLIFKLF